MGIGCLIAVAHAAAIFADDSEWTRPVMTGDRLFIRVAESPDMDKIYAVASDGTIDMGFVGPVKVADLTLPAAADKIEQELERNYFKKATVSVSVSEHVTGNVLIIGAVKGPGEIPLPSDSVMTLMEAISLAGGFNEDASVEQVRILRWKPGMGVQREIIVVDMRGLYDKGDFSRDQFLRPKDLIVVPSSGQAQGGEFLALGQVVQPGFHTATDGLDLIRAITKVGGVTQLAKTDACRMLRRMDNGQYRVIPLNLDRLFGSADMSINQPVLPGDVLFVPSAEQAASGKVFLLGAVPRRGAVPISLEKEATLAKTILENGGLGEFGDGGRVKVLRTAPDGSKQTLVVDVNRILKDGDFESDVQLRNEDVIIVPERMFAL